MKVKSIKSTIFSKMVLTVCLAVVTAVAAMLFIACIIYSSNTKNEIMTSTRSVASYMDTLSSAGDKLSFLHSMFDNNEDGRKTFIAPGGEVLYDNDADALSMENHLSRPEVKQARETGAGSATRSSDTVGKSFFYYAVRLNDGSVLRSEKPLIAIYDMLPAMIPASMLLLLIIMVITGFASSTITRNIMLPIYKIDINNIDEGEIYPELLPYFRRIKAENEERAKTDTIRREFSANVSHELKTPLTSISGYAQMITNGMARPEDTAMFGLKIEKEAERLLLLIDDIIRLSNLDETTGVYKPEEIRLDELANEAVKHLESQIERKEIKVEQKGGECVIAGSRTLVSEMIYNLIDNAIKYNREGGSIDIYTGETPDGTVFSVHDTGIGIAQEDIDRIFERFYRVDKSHSKTVGGTGLGLSIVKHVALVHNARIDVSSTLGEGTTISVIFRAV